MRDSPLELRKKWGSREVRFTVHVLIGNPPAASSGPVSFEGQRKSGGRWIWQTHLIRFFYRTGSLHPHINDRLGKLRRWIDSVRAEVSEREVTATLGLSGGLRTARSDLMKALGEASIGKIRQIYVSSLVPI